MDRMEHLGDESGVWSTDTPDIYLVKLPYKVK